MTNSGSRKGGNMKRTFSVIVLALVTLLVFFSGAFAGEKDVLKALEKIKASVEAGVNYAKYRKLVDDAMVKINVYKRGKKINKVFLHNANLSYEYYYTAAKSWETKIMYSGRSDVSLDKDMQAHWSDAESFLNKAHEALKQTTGYKKEG